MSIETRIRAATEATAATVSEIRPLTLPAGPAPARPHWFRSLRPGRPWGNWLIPLAAAAAVIAVAATLVAVKSFSAAGPGSHPAPASSSTAALPGGFPRYYAAESTTGPVTRATETEVVGDARTGKLLATFKPPKGVAFGTVAAAANDRTFVVEAQERLPTIPTWSWELSWYVLQLTPGAAQPVRLARIPVTDPFITAQVSTVAVSPDGSSFAVVFRAASTSNYEVTGADPLTLRTYSVATGRLLRSWTAPLTQQRDLYSVGGLTWLDDGQTLAYAYPADKVQRVVRTLNVTSPGTNLIAGSRTVFTVPDGHTCDSALLITGDGKSVICGVFATNNGWCTTGQLTLDAYSVATGKLDRVLYRYQGKCQMGTTVALWARSAGLAVALITITKPARPPAFGPLTARVGLLTPGRFTSLPVTMAGMADEDFSLIAF